MATYEVDKSKRVAVISLDQSPFNALSHGVRSGIVQGLDSALADASIDFIVIRGSNQGFCAGADISEFATGKSTEEPTLATVLDKLDSATKPVIAAIHGVALGGGLELALTTHYRVAVKGTKLGLPEVKLGLIPGAGGTQRLPRLAGVAKAADMVTTGAQIDAAEALSHKIVDAVHDAPNNKDGALSAAIAFIASHGSKLVVRRVRDLAVPQPPQGFFEKAEKDIKQRTRGFEAPLKNLEAIKYAAQLPFDEGIEKERDIFISCAVSDQARAQQYFFFAERKATKPPVPNDVKPTPVSSVGVLGAGTMGSGIAISLLDAGYRVTIVETEEKFLSAGVKRIRDHYVSLVKRGRISQEKAEKLSSALNSTIKYEDLSQVDLVIEAVFENMELKKQIFGRLDKICKPSAYLCSNTSTLDIDEMANATSRPEKVIGTHFFSPANIMKLLELVRGKKTSNDTIATVFELGKKINKVCVLVGNCDGFVGNRMMFPYTNEATFLVEEGATPRQVDNILYNFGLAMGPLAVGDLSGLDIGYKIRHGKNLHLDKSKRYPLIADRLVEAGRLGQKSLKGWYKYDPSNPRKPLDDPEIDAIIEKSVADSGIKRRAISDEEILWRSILPLINEGFKVLEEGIAQQPSDIDVIYVYGYGFPVYRGGPMFFADLVGLPVILEKIRQYGTKNPTMEYWTPSKLLVELVEKDVSLAQYWSRKNRSKL